MEGNGVVLHSQRLFYLDATYGALFIALVLGAVLFGFTIIQTFLYFRANPKRGFFGYKFVVLWLCFHDALHLALVAHALYFYLITNYVNPSALLVVSWSIKLQVPVTMFCVYTIHCLYAHRIWILSKGRKRMLLQVVGQTVIIALDTAVAVVICVAVYRCYFFQDLIGVEWALYLTLAVMAFNDVVVAVSMCWLLASYRTGYTRTDTTIQTLTMYIVHTGCLTSLFSMLTLVTYAAMPRNFVFLGFEFLLIKVYVNSYLALLNARQFFRSHEDDKLPNSNARYDQPSTGFRLPFIPKVYLGDTSTATWAATGADLVPNGAPPSYR